VNVSHLDNSQQGQQYQTHQGNNRQSPWLCATFPAWKCLKSCQNTFPGLKDTHVLDALKAETF
jgi:hypothetical protein